MEKRKVKLSIIILSFNTKELLKKCLESVTSGQWLVTSGTKVKKPVTSHQLPVTEIMVVDNGSTDGSVEMVEGMVTSYQWPAASGPKIKKPASSHQSPVTSHQSLINLRLIKNSSNLGYAKGNNIGIKAAKGEYIMVLNSDTLIKPGAFEKLVKFLDDSQEADIVGPRLLNTDGSSQPNCGRFPGLLVSAVMLFKEHFGGSDLVRFSPQQNRLVDWLMGAAFMARKKVFEKIGGFDENIFMYMEEIEWFYRAKKSGFKTYFLKEAEIIHLGRGSAKFGKREPILNIYRGLIYFYRKHKNFFELFILIILLKLKALIALLVGYFKKDYYLIETYGEAFKIY